MAQHIHALTLVVPDYDAGIEFYVGKMGFELVSDITLSETKRWVLVAPKGAQTHILLAKADSPEQIAAIGNQTGGRVGFFLATDDFETDYAWMQEKGISFLEAPRHESYGSVVVWSDPFGNTWDLLHLRTAP